MLSLLFVNNQTVLLFRSSQAVPIVGGGSDILGLLFSCSQIVHIMG